MLSTNTLPIEYLLRMGYARRSNPAVAGGELIKAYEEISKLENLNSQYGDAMQRQHAEVMEQYRNLEGYALETTEKYEQAVANLDSERNDFITHLSEGIQSQRGEGNRRLREQLLDGKNSEIGSFERGWLKPYYARTLMENISEDRDAKRFAQESAQKIKDAGLEENTSRSMTWTKLFKAYDNVNILPDDRKVLMPFDDGPQPTVLRGIKFSDLITVYALTDLFPDPGRERDILGDVFDGEGDAAMEDDLWDFDRARDGDNM